ncbi:hypothetical protein N0V82_003303 [Gnomoniopsis sp. IMI 355080]|nr:hypothetical protein N0V82_003303 [Gnomoniopsis sp. IMI 355080]
MIKISHLGCISIKAVKAVKAGGSARLPPPIPNGLALSPQSTADRSSLTNPLPSTEADVSVHLAELVMEDSEDGICDDELAHTAKNRSTSTLEAVKARIRRHLSLDSIPGQSESEEQIARRAEVKRLMRKRIQEELQSENSPVLGGSSTLQHPAAPSVASVTVLGNGPRDTIEFTVDEVTKDKEVPRGRIAELSDSLDSGVRHNLTVACKRSTHSSDKENRQVESRTVNLRDWVEDDLQATESGYHKHFRKRSSLPEIPVSPQLKPVRTASLHDAAALASWRLSLRHQSSSKAPEESKPDPPPKPRPGTTDTPSLVLSHTRQTTLDTGSETSSFVRREAELRTVEERFRDSHLRNKPLVFTGSRFQEVLSDNPRFAARNSLLSRLELNLPVDFDIFVEKFDGNNSDHGHLASAAARKSNKRKSDKLDAPDSGHLRVPSIDYDKSKSTVKGPSLSKARNGSSRARGFSSSRDGDETAEMWKRALRAESVSTPVRCSTSPQPVVPQHSPPATKANSRLPRPPCPSERGGLSGDDSVMHSPTCTELLTQIDEEVFRQSLVRSNIILEEWGRQLGEQDRRPTPRTHSLPFESRCIYRNSITPPASWAKFPSHNREERNAIAGELDSVKPRDFAVREVSAVGGIMWTTDKVEDGTPSHRSVVRSVSDRFTQPLKSRWSKLVPRWAGTNVKDKSIFGARRSSIQASGDLEYPELELLPTAGGYRELLALEREINEMKGTVEPKIWSSSDESAVPGNRSSLIEKMNGALQHDGSSDTDDLKPRHMADSIEAQASPAGIRLPTTPATQAAFPDCMHYKDLTDSSGERYVTPFTHFSPSRPLTPQPTFQPFAASSTPGSTASSSSMVRHTSLCVRNKTFDPMMKGTQLDSSNGRRNIRRRSAPPESPEFD